MHMMKLGGLVMFERELMRPKRKRRMPRTAVTSFKIVKSSILILYYLARRFLDDF